MEATYNALEYTDRDNFKRAEYRISGSTASGWILRRNGAPHLELGPGYRLLKTRRCGVCSTDLSRRFLPFPLPQVIGHEVVAADPDSGEAFVVEINDTCAARGDGTPDPFCASGLPTHCPGRMVLGIDRLPGGFGPYILVPVRAAIPIGDTPERAAVLVEPFAAALHAVMTSRPRAGDRVAVLGPGRLGLLLVAALSLYRKRTGAGFALSLIGRRGRNFARGRRLGADETILLAEGTAGRMKQYDIVFDASGSPEGFETALALSRREVHLKSTHGRECRGLRHPTELVVDELSLLKNDPENLDFRWEGEARKNEWAHLSPDANPDPPGDCRFIRGDTGSAVDYIQSGEPMNPIRRFDLAIATSIEEIDACIRPAPGSELSLVRPRGAILYDGKDTGDPLLSFLAAGRRVRSSRCGDFRTAIDCLAGEKELLVSLENEVITHEFPADRLPEAFEAARSGDAVKVIIRHD